MAVTVTRTFGPLTNLTLLRRDDWDRVGRLAREAIVLRTRQGKDRDERQMTPYSPGYAALKAKELGSARVNLTVSGEMLNNIAIQADDKGVTLAFTR
jgi:hypothetical protein